MDLMLQLFASWFYQRAFYAYMIYTELQLCHIPYANTGVHPMPMLRDIVDAERCDKLLARTQAGDCPSQELLGCLTSLSLSAVVLSRG
jgi:hypothetical protein